MGTLNDVYCLLHLPIEGTLLDHQGIISKPEGIVLMVTNLGASPPPLLTMKAL
jgi:hypothetical protein